jgi:hypothetical protein
MHIIDTRNYYCTVFTCIWILFLQVLIMSIWQQKRDNSGFRSSDWLKNGEYLCQREGHQYYLRRASTLSTDRTACFSNSLCTLYLVFSQRLGTACDSIILKFSDCLIQYWFVGYFQDLVWHWFSISFPLFCVVFSNLDNKHKGDI